MKILRILPLFGCLLLLIALTTSCQAQAPVAKVLKSEEGRQQAEYLLARKGQQYQLNIKLKDNEALVLIQDHKGQKLGRARFTLDGNRLQVDMQQSQKGLLPFWQFAVERLSSRGGTLVLMKMAEQAPRSCEECMAQLKAAVKADDQPEAFYTAVSIGTGTCDGYIPCTQALLDLYYECREICEQKGKQSPR